MLAVRRLAFNAKEPDKCTRACCARRCAFIHAHVCTCVRVRVRACAYFVAVPFSSKHHSGGR